MSIQLLNYIITSSQDIPDENGNVGGHFSWDNEPSKKEKIAIGTKKNGTVIYLGNPFRAARDMGEMIYNKRELLENKLSPVYSTMGRFIFNKDWQGKTILKEGDDWWKHIKDGSKFWAKGLTGYETLYSTFNPDPESSLNFLRFGGGQVSSGARGGMVAGNISSLLREQSEDRMYTLTEASEMLRYGDEDGAINFLMDNNFTNEELRNFSDKSNHPYAYLLENLNLRSMYRRATPEQKKRLDKLFPPIKIKDKTKDKTSSIGKKIISNILEGIIPSAQAGTLPVNKGLYSDIQEYIRLKEEAPKGSERRKISYYLNERERKLGILTGGIGHSMTDAEQVLYPEGTIIPDGLIADWFKKDLNTAILAAITQANMIGRDDSEFIKSLASVNFQLGVSWFKDIKNPDGSIKKKGHTETWKLLMDGEWEEAAREAANSKWNKQTPNRVKDFQQAIRNYK